MRHPDTSRSLSGRTALALVLGALALGLIGSCALPGVPAATTPSSGTSPRTDTVQLSWNANAEGNLAGYKLYMGTVSGIYGSPTTLGLATTTTVTALVPGTTYYFALTAFNLAGQESSKSLEITYSAP